MADEKLNTGPGSEKLPEAPEPVAADQPQAPAPEQAAAPTPQQEQAGPAQPAPGDVVVSFDKINELMGEKRQAARAQVEKEAAGKDGKEELPAAGGDKPKTPRRGRPPKEEKRGPLARRKQSHARAARPRRIKRPPERQSRLNETKCPEVTAKPRMPQRTLPSGRPLSRSRLLPIPPPRPVPLTKESWFI